MTPYYNRAGHAVAYASMTSPKDRVMCTFRTGRGVYEWLTKDAKRLNMDRSELIRRMLYYAGSKMTDAEKLKEIKK